MVRALPGAATALLLVLVAASSGSCRQVIAAALRTPACNDAPCPVPEADLELVQVVFRHSNRGPFAWNPYLSSAGSFAGCRAAYEGFSINLMNEVDGGSGPALHDLSKSPLPGDGRCQEGWLTPSGYLAATDLGQYLRGKYVSDTGTPRLLDSQFDPASVWAHSTPYQRTTNTLRGVLTGLFPIAAAAGTNMTVWAVNSTYEYMYTSGSFCPPLKSLLKQQEDLAAEKLAKDPLVQRQALEVMKALKLPGVNFSTFGGDCGAPKSNASLCWIQAYDALATALANRNSWPTAADKQLYDLVNQRASEASYHAYTPAAPDACLLESGNCTANLAYGGMGTLMWRLLGNMLNVANGSCGVVGFPQTSGCPAKPPKMMLYAGHDNTLFGLLAILGQETPSAWPWYASHFEFELWKMKATGARFVRILYNGKSIHVPGTPSNSHATLAQFRSVVAPHTVPQQLHQDFCWPSAGARGVQGAPLQQVTQPQTTCASKSSSSTKQAHRQLALQPDLAVACP